MYTREEFEQLRMEAAQEMAGDRQLAREANGVLVQADRYHWIHQTTWFGEPTLQLPQDLFAFQEIIFKTRPKFIVEVGVAWGGSLLMYSTLLEVLGGGQIIGIDVYIPDDLKRRLASHQTLFDCVTLIQGSSIEESTLQQVRAIIGDSKEVMVHLDSCHSHDHVLQELRGYSALVGKGHYLICGDTITEYMPEQTHRPRPWGPGNNPKTALDVFLAENRRFEVDKRIDSKLLFSCNPGGYLACLE